MVNVKISRLIGNKEVKNSGWLIAGKVIQIILSFFVSILTARYLGPSNYGLINYAGAYVLFFTSLCTLGINAVIIKDFSDNPDEQGQAIGTTLIARAVSSFLSAVLIVGIVSIVDRDEKTTLIVTALCSVALVFQIFDTFNYWFQSLYQSKITAIATLVAYVITSAYKVLLLARNKSVEWFAFATSVDYIVLAIVLLVSYKMYNGPRLTFSFDKAKYLLRNSYHYIISGMMVAIYGQTDKIMLKKMVNEAEVGYYSLASSINAMWVFVLQAIIDSVYPTIIKLKKEDEKAYEKKNRQLYAIVIYVSIFVAIMFMIFGNLALRILYGEEYVPAGSSLKIITWYTIFSYLGVARNAWVVCEHKQKYLKYMYFSAVIINIGLNALLIPIWGAAGAAIASLVTQFCTGILLPFLIKPFRPNAKMMLDAFLLKDIGWKNNS